MRKISLLLMILFAVSCGVKTFPLKGSYPAPPVIHYSDKNVDKVWEKIIDLFAQNNIPIKLIDKASGLIISDATKLTWSFEDKNGKLINKEAQVVIEKVLDKGSNKYIKPYYVTGTWNVRVKQEGERTSINVNLFNILGYGRSTMGDSYPLDGRSTGEFEKLISDIVK